MFRVIECLNAIFSQNSATLHWTIKSFNLRFTALKALWGLNAPLWLFCFVFCCCLLFPPNNKNKDINTFKPFLPYF